MNSHAIKHVLIDSNSQDLKLRRRIIAASTFGLIDFTIISLYQTGIVKKLPDLPFKIFDSNKVNAAKDAHVMGIPDGPIGVVAYITIIFLATAGHTGTGQKPIYRSLLVATVLANAAGAGYYIVNMIFKQKKLCLYCLIGAVVNFTSASLATNLNYFKRHK